MAISTATPTVMTIITIMMRTTVIPTTTTTIIIMTIHMIMAPITMAKARPAPPCPA